MLKCVHEITFVKLCKHIIINQDMLYDLYEWGKYQTNITSIVLLINKDITKQVIWERGTMLQTPHWLKWGAPHLPPPLTQIIPSHGPIIPKPNYLHLQGNHPTYHPKPHPYVISRFATVYWTDTHTHKPTDSWRECSMTIGRFHSIERKPWNGNDNYLMKTIFRHIYYSVC